MSISPRVHSSSGELSEKSEVAVTDAYLESCAIHKNSEHPTESSWRRRVQNRCDVERISTHSLTIVPQKVFCFEKHALESENNKIALLWLFTERNIQLYELNNARCQGIIPLSDNDISCIKSFYSSSSHLQGPLKIRGVLAVGLKSGDCLLYDGYSGTHLQTLSPPNTVPNKVGVEVISCNCPSIYSDWAVKDDEEPVDLLMVGYENGSFNEWQLDWKTQIPCSSETVYKEWFISSKHCLKDAQYVAYLRLWIVLSDRALLFLDRQGCVSDQLATEWRLSQLLLMESIFLTKQTDRKIIMLVISEDGTLYSYELHYLMNKSPRIEPLDSSLLSLKDYTNICSFCQLCCEYFLLGSFDGSISLFQWKQSTLGHLVPVCLYKKIIHSYKFYFISCKRENRAFIIRTYCSAENQIATTCVVVKHKPECLGISSAIACGGCYESSVSKSEEALQDAFYKQQEVGNEESLHQSTVDFSSNATIAPELTNIFEKRGKMLFSGRHNNAENVVDIANNKSMTLPLREIEERFQLLQIEYEQEKKIHQRLRDELLNRALEAEEQVERLEAKLKEMQLRRYQQESLKEEKSSSHSEPNQDFDKEKIALLERQLQEALESKQFLMAQAKEDIDYLQSRVEALDGVLLSSQQELEDFISTTVEMNEHIAEALDGLTDEAFEQLGGFEEVFRDWMAAVRERLYRQRKRKEEVKEEIHTLQNMFRVIDHSASNSNKYEKWIQEENSPNTDAADATPRSRLLLHQVKVALQHRIMQLEEQLKQIRDYHSKESDTKAVSMIKELQAQLEQAEQRIHRLEEEKEQIAMAHDRLLEDNAALETENERLQLQLRRAVEAASYYSGRDTVSPLEPTTPREDHASTSSKN